MEGRANYLTWLLKNRDSDWSFWRAGGRSVSADHRKTNKGIPHPEGVPEQKPELLWHTFSVRIHFFSNPVVFARRYDHRLLSGNPGCCLDPKFGRVDRVLSAWGAAHHHRLPPCPSQNRTSGFPNIRLFSHHSRPADGETDSNDVPFSLMATRPRRGRLCNDPSCSSASGFADSAICTRAS